VYYVRHTDKKKKMQLEIIGKIHTPFRTKEECPIQPIYSSDAEGQIEVFKKYDVGLKDIETFSHIYIIYLFDRAGEVQFVRSTFLDDEPHGIYASRHPCRPNSIGMSIVQLKKRYGNILVVKGVDVLNGTPLLDIKPYMPKYDIIESASNGWSDGLEWRPKPSNRE
jgi:tRNA-Thr(GGU) m(6)t(6)A37 methyltransferase TsaA